MAEKAAHLDCYYLRKLRVSTDSIYWCELSDYPCEVEYNGTECEELNEQLKEESDGESEVQYL